MSSPTPQSPKTWLDRIAMWYLIASGAIFAVQVLWYLRDQPAAIGIFVWIVLAFAAAYWLGGRIDAGKHPDPQ